MNRVELKSVSEAIDGQGIKACVYGFAGTGKTRLLATLPGKGLVASAEAGLLSLKDVPHTGHISVAVISTMDDLRTVYAMLTKPDHGFGWVALDSVSEIAEVLLSTEKKKEKDPRKAYGTLVEEMGVVLRAFRDLPAIDVYFSAKAEKVKEEDTGRVSVQILVPGSKLGQQIPYLFDEVFQLVVVDVTDDKGRPTGESTRWLQTRKDSRCDCKDRSGKLDAFEPADLGAVFAKIRGNSAAQKGA